MEALEKKDRERIKVASPRSLNGSVYIDEVLKKSYPNSNRWDYVISYKRSKGEYLYWVETHTGSDKEIKVVQKKLEWLKNWLKGEGKKLAEFDGMYFWVSSGKTSFTNGSTQVKTLAAKGLLYVSRLTIS